MKNAWWRTVCVVYGFSLFSMWAAYTLRSVSAADAFEQGLEGWVVEGTDAVEGSSHKVPVWTYESGVVRCSGHGFGYLRYREPVSDFRLELEYRFPKNGNSGIGIRTVPFTGPLETRPSQAAYEIQLLSDAGKTADRGSCCSLYGHEAPNRNTSRAVGEWNSIVVECIGPRVRLEHNGEKVIDFDQSTRKDTAKKPLSGSICLQNHGSVVEFRHVRLTRFQSSRTDSR